ncbi:phosphomannomutase/phosphoglucomutase [Legionella sp. WA2022007384]
MPKSYLICPPVSIFKEYDIRNLIGESLNENTYYTLGVAIGNELQEIYKLHTLLLCRDGRGSSAAFSAALAKGLLISGINIIDLSSLPTPLMHYAMFYLQCASGLIVTASHNPIEYNGLKIILGGQNYHGERLQGLYNRILDKKLEPFAHSSGKLIKYPERQIINHYIDAIKANVGPIKKLRVVVDCGNAVAGYVAPQLLASLGCDVIPLSCDVLPTFVNHNPDPSIEENLVDLQQMVLEQHADCGVAFDGDGDRLGVVDSHGNIIPSDYLLLAFADASLKKNANQAFVFDVKCTQCLSECITQNNGMAIMTKTGMAHIMEGMQKHQAVIGGEFCGHFYFSDRWLAYDDGIYAAVRTLELLSTQSLDSHDFFEQYPKLLSTNEIKIDIADELKEEFMHQLLAQAPQYLHGELLHIDGLRANLDDAWGLIRPSNTSPYLTLRFEAKTSEGMEDVKQRFAKLITQVNPLLKLPF